MEMFFVHLFIILSIATASRATTCGYKDGDPNSPRTAQPGYGCRVDTANGLWGFCPTTVISAKDCGLAGVCVDSHSCTKGCGRLTDRADITTFSCERSQFCSTVLLINGPDQSFEYIACGANAQTDSLLPARNAAETTTTPSSSTSVPNTVSLPSRPTSTVIETSSVLSSTSGSAVQSSLISSTSAPTSSTSKQEPVNLGAIIGGALGGLALICLTILGTVLIRRKQGAKGHGSSATSHTSRGWSKFGGNATPHIDSAEEIQKKQHWSHGPVEMYSGHHVNMEPVELSGHVQHIYTPK